MTGDPAIVTLTPRGQELAHRLACALGRGEVIPPPEDVRATLQALFRADRPLICVMALGIVVRILGPLTRDKRAEPAVVVIDEAGRFVIPVLGGHAADANALALEAARALGAIPVLTTASDALGLPAVDRIGRAWGWQLEDGTNLTAAAAAVVRGEPVGVWQDAGRRDWWRPFGDWPSSFSTLDRWPPQRDYAALLVITDREVLDPGRGPLLVYRPPSLALGVGCRRGVPCAEIEELFQEVCRTEAFAPRSLGVVATASLKADEPGLIGFAARHAVPLRAFSVDELQSVGPLPTPSEAVRQRVGVWGVAEPAAMLAAGTRQLLMPKRRGRRVTMALARRRKDEG